MEISETRRMELYQLQEIVEKPQVYYKHPKVNNLAPPHIPADMRKRKEPKEPKRPQKTEYKPKPYKARYKSVLIPRMPRRAKCTL